MRPDWRINYHLPITQWCASIKSQAGAHNGFALNTVIFVL